MLNKAQRIRLLFATILIGKQTYAVSKTKQRVLNGGYIMADWQKAKDKANDVLVSNSITSPFVDVQYIASANGIKIVPFKPDESHKEVAGFLDKNGDKPVLYVNAEESAQRQTFTIAHELGHYFLGHGSDQWGINWRDGRQEQTDAEQEANYFAACLLMPEEMVKQQIKKYKISVDDYHTLAGLFGVSPDAMRHRLNFLKIK